MKKKIIIITIITFIIAIIAIMFFILRYNTNNSKVIYSSSYTLRAHIPHYYSIKIYDNGVIKSEDKYTGKNKQKIKK